MQRGLPRCARQSGKIPRRALVGATQFCVGFVWKKSLCLLLYNALKPMEGFSIRGWESKRKKERLLQRLEGDGPLFLTPGIEWPPRQRDGSDTAARCGSRANQRFPQAKSWKQKKHIWKLTNSQRLCIDHRRGMNYASRPEHWTVNTLKAFPVSYHKKVGHNLWVHSSFFFFWSTP